MKKVLLNKVVKGKWIMIVHEILLWKTNCSLSAKSGKSTDFSNLVSDTRSNLIENLSKIIEFHCPEADRPIYFIFDNLDSLLALTDLLMIICNLNQLLRSHWEDRNSETRPSVCTIFISNCPWERYLSGTFYCEPTCIAVPAYNKEEALELLVAQKPHTVDKTLYAWFIDLFLTVCFPVTRNLSELAHLAKRNWPTFYHLIETGAVDQSDTWGQWKLLQPQLRKSLSEIYLRTDTDSLQIQDTASLLELPLLARYMAVAAFMASYNSPSADRKFLVKNTGKMSARAKTMEKKADKTENCLNGPKLFTLERLLAIFRALTLDESIGYNSLTFTQINLLLKLGLIAPGVLDDDLFNPKYRCHMSLDLSRSVAKSLDFDLNSHLTDFA
ncbi:Origin recognition complex subunit 5 [Cichlidogyrus casuarinus]|uniref:Origin recognition complex subunit 5 n=1 Tax=Cichlidogyrus casuarinus TaxID=1844966 RepID=A0ABD2QA09_9PLAT